MTTGTTATTPGQLVDALVIGVCVGFVAVGVSAFFMGCLTVNPVLIAGGSGMVFASRRAMRHVRENPL